MCAAGVGCMLPWRLLHVIHNWGASVWFCLEGDPHAEQGYRLLVGFGAEEGLGFIA